MSLYKAGGQYKVGHSEHVFGVPVLSYFDDEEQIYYLVAPALDVVGAGETEEDAKASFQITLDEFVRYCCNKQTILAELERLGWKIKKKGKKDFEANPPSIEYLQNDPDWAEIWDKNPKVDSREVMFAI